MMFISYMDLFTNDSNFPIEKTLKIHSITIAIKSLIEKDNKFYLELALNRCLFEPYEIKL